MTAPPRPLSPPIITIEPESSSLTKPSSVVSMPTSAGDCKSYTTVPTTPSLLSFASVSVTPPPKAPSSRPEFSAAVPQVHRAPGSNLSGTNMTRWMQTVRFGDTSPEARAKITSLLMQTEGPRFPEYGYEARVQERDLSEEEEEHKDKVGGYDMNRDEGERDAQGNLIDQSREPAETSSMGGGGVGNQGTLAAGLPEVLVATMD